MLPDLRAVSSWGYQLPVDCCKTTAFGASI